MTAVNKDKDLAEFIDNDESCEGSDCSGAADKISYHHRHVMLLAQIYLTLSLSPFVFAGRSSRLHSALLLYKISYTENYPGPKRLMHHYTKSSTQIISAN